VVEELGRRHPLLRRLRALRRDPARRRTEGLLLAEGLHLAAEVLRSAVRVELVVSSPRLERAPGGRELLREIDDRGLPRVLVADAVLDDLQDARTAQPILMLVQRPERAPDAGLEPAGGVPLVAVADGVQDPGNLGSLLRTAHAAGATAFAATGEGADPFHPRAVRASAGSVLRFPPLVEPRSTLVERLRRRRIVCIGADPAGRLDHRRADLTRPVALFFGGEGRGLAPPLREVLDETVRIALQAEVESLSVTAAAAVLLFEAARQRAGEA
jgi:TrmH family RNA methyltransferase